MKMTRSIEREHLRIMLSVDSYIEDVYEWFWDMVSEYFTHE